MKLNESSCEISKKMVMIISKKVICQLNEERKYSSSMKIEEEEISCNDNRNEEINEAKKMKEEANEISKAFYLIARKT